MKVRRPKAVVPHIPFISLADIAWQIIIFFLLASSFSSNFSLSVPMPTASPANSEPVQKTISVKAGEHDLTVNGVNVAQYELQSYVGSLLTGITRDEERAVILYPEDDLSFQKTADVLYAIQKAGGIVVISEERRDAGTTKTP